MVGQAFLPEQVATDPVVGPDLQPLGDDGPRSREKLEKYLYDFADPRLTADALIALCENGGAKAYKAYIIAAGTSEIAWDRYDDIARSALYTAGEYLRHHRDRDFARMLLEVIERGRGRERARMAYRERSLIGHAERAACIAAGADPDRLLYEKDAARDAATVARFLKRFLAQRQNG